MATHTSAVNGSGSSWIFIFSKFSAEALLFEGILICLLTATYTGFWVLRKRKLGVIDQTVPAGIVKSYLSELMMDAEQMRAQLFGLLSAAGISSPEAYRANTGTPVAAAVGPEFSQKIAQLEAKMAEQAKAMESILGEKHKIEKDLVDARALGAKNTGDGPNPVVTQMQEKIQVLETKLAEYSVIEDDLANLKKLQQENLKLRSLLSEKGIEAPATIAAPAAMAAAPKPPVAAEMIPQAAAPVVEELPSFEGLVDQVEESLQSTAAASSAEPSTTAAPAGNMEKSDADLVAEFEKMLNG